MRPPSHLLWTFSTVVKFGGVSRAAEALHLTPSAVSKQVQDLEEWVGMTLFERSRKRLALTPAGTRYEAAIRTVLAQLEAATLELITSTEEGGALRVAVLPTFSAKWLIPRLADFQRTHPRVTLHFVPHVQGYDFTDPELDCSILFGDGHWPGARSHYIAGRETALIVPGQELAGSEVRTPRDILRFPLLWHIRTPDAWARWGEAHGVDPKVGTLGPQFDQFETIIRAVMAGLGAALVPRCLVIDDIHSGRVQEPIENGGYLSERGYWLCHPQSRSQMDQFVDFRDWLILQSSSGEKGLFDQPLAGRPNLG